MNSVKGQSLIFAVLLFLSLSWPASSSATDRIEGQVKGGGSPIAKAEVTLWVTTSGAPRKLAQTKTADDGSFQLSTAGKNDIASVLYLTSEGGVATAGTSTKPNPAITMMATLGTKPLPHVTINELTTVASAWTGAQFLNGSSLTVIAVAAAPDHERRCELGNGG